MSSGVENLRLRQLYQGFRPLPIAAMDARERRRPASLCLQCTIIASFGEKRRPDPIPLLGDVQGLNSFAHSQQLLRLTGVELYAVGLAVTAAAFGATMAYAGSDLGGPFWAVAALGFVAICAERQPVRIARNTEVTVSVLPIVFAAVVYGPLAAMAVGALGMAGDFRRPLSRWAIWTSMRAIAGGIAGSAAVLILEQGTGFGTLFCAVVAASIADAAVDAALAALTVEVRGTGTFRAFLRSVKPVVFGTLPLYVPVIVLLVYAYRELSVWSLPLFFAPAFAAHKLYGLYREQQEAADKLGQANVRLERANLSFASALVAALDARDQYTAGHSAAVAVYARDIAARMQLGEAQEQLIHVAGLVHDIGKVGLPPGILEKPGPLTLEERRIMEQHPVIGERILANVDDYAEIALIVRHHHERVDGEGYPDGLHQDEIPLLSKIIGVADAYNAMTSGRPYRDAMPSRVARLRLAQAVGTQFDTAVVAAFEAILACAGEAYLAGAREDFTFEAQRFSPVGYPVLSVAAG
jgi:putative nucleotidyltransferase with HDIG domain